MKKQMSLLIFLIALVVQGNSQNTDFYYSSPKQGADFINPEQVILLKSQSEIAAIDKTMIGLYNNNVSVAFEINIEKGKLLFITPSEKLKRNASYHLELKQGAIQFADKESDAFELTFSTEKNDNTDLLISYRQHENKILLDQLANKRKEST